jgi:hypothetical protein
MDNKIATRTMSCMIGADGNNMDETFQRKNHIACAVLEELLASNTNGVLVLALQNSELGRNLTTPLTDENSIGYTWLATAQFVFFR